MGNIRSTVGLCLVFITIVVSMFVLSVTREPQLSIEEMRSKGVFILPRPRDIAPFELIDHQGRTFDNDRLKDKWSFVFFGFTNCPDVCPTSMSVLGQVERALLANNLETSAQFQGVLVTVDPERDKAEALGAYATAFSPRFWGITGGREALAEVARQVNVAFAKVPLRDAQGTPVPGTYTMDHTGNIVIINPKGHYHGFIKLPHDAETIRLTFQTLVSQF